MCCLVGLPRYTSQSPATSNSCRRKSILVLVRDVVRLINSAAKSARRYGLFYGSATPTKTMRKTTDTLLNLVGTNAKEAKNYRWKEGSAGIFVKI